MWIPGEYVESALREVLTADDTQVDATAGHAALLLACCGHSGEADRLARRWHEVTERPAAALTPDPVDARAWAMLFAARGERPDWADALPPLDLDAEESAHRAYLARREPSIPAGLLGDSAAARIVSGVADRLGESPAPDPVRAAAAEVESLARRGEPVEDALAAWASAAGRADRPKVGTLGGCRAVAPLLVSGALAGPLGLDEGWARRIAGDLMAALRMRYPRPEARLSWRELVDRILELREAGTAPPPVTADVLERAERRLGFALPEDYREFLRTCDGLPADVVFPRLLGAAELVPAEGGVVVIGDPGPPVLTLARAGERWVAVSWDPVSGSTPFPGFRALLEEHLRLLEESR
ncbi:SMI1/KNR4 family protein [Amycolatopsis anabasis]|uniref:SMI1/KNR4 family protein n=1 Tax=Amycolatopsis anabasis TaxID=1840409 RepID=UPI001FE33D4E|nr:SMI1/KNR4 family protein [Amycolatopsis anabasis]